MSAVMRVRLRYLIGRAARRLRRLILGPCPHPAPYFADSIGDIYCRKCGKDLT